MKKVFTILAAMSAITILALTSCKKNDPKQEITFLNATAQYVESFVGKSVEEFESASVKSNLAKYEGKLPENMISYRNEIQGIDVAIKHNSSNIIIYIHYDKNGDITANMNLFMGWLDEVINEDYAYFKGWNNNDYENLCFKNTSEFKNSISSDLADSTCEFYKQSGACGLHFSDTNAFIDFCSPEEEEMYDGCKKDAMSRCGE